MIKISVVKDDFIKSVNIKGHALYADYGKDIVCAAVSSIIITTINALEMINENALEVDLGGFTIYVLKEDEIVNKLMLNMINLLNDLAGDYPQNIKFL